MSERKPGFYWVKIDDEMGWECAFWDDFSQSLLTFEFGAMPESKIALIGPRISPPDETNQPPWMKAIDEALVTTHLGTAETSDSYDTAKRKLGELIDWHVAVALDERVNGGWRLVPVEPTAEMMQAGRWSGSGDVSVNEEWARRELWRRMLAAAPKP